MTDNFFIIKFLKCILYHKAFASPDTRSGDAKFYAVSDSLSGNFTCGVAGETYTELFEDFAVYFA